MQPNLLALLYGNNSSYASGQTLAEGLGVTRAAVWKAVEALRADGYEIQSSKARGYRLVTVPDLLGAREINLRLTTKDLGRRICSLDSVNSTNSHASRLAAEGEPEGTLVISEGQTAGRGRLGRKWVSPPGVNIYMSLILRPKISPADAPLITLAAAAALTASVKNNYNLDAAIKWPNDLLIKGKKAAGILTEMNAEPDRVRHIILGVGIDVNMPLSLFPEDIRDISTSLMLELGRKVDRAEVLCSFLQELEKFYGMLERGAREGILNAWRSMSCTLGRKVRVVGVGWEKTGLAKDIDASGSLILVSDGGKKETISSGDVFFLS